MNAKEFLSQAYCLNKLIESHERELAELEQMGVIISSSNFSGMPITARNLEPPFVRQVTKKIDLEIQIRNELNDLIDLKKKIHDAINAVSLPMQRLILRYRYIEFYTWEQIAHCVNYSMMQVHRLHANALNSVTVPK